MRDVKLFEITRTFHPDPSAPNGVCTERDVLWAVASGTARPATWAGPERVADALFLRGVVEEIAVATGVGLGFAEVEESALPVATALHPYRRLAITHRGAVVGVLGEVHPRVVEAFKLKKLRPVYLEVSVDALYAAAERRAYVEPPRVPPVERALAFTLPVGPGAVPVGDVVDTMREAGGAALVGVGLREAFEHTVDDVPCTTWTLTLSWANDDATATADALNAATERVAAAVLAAFEDRGVARRAG